MEAAKQYLVGYVVEKSLAMDNIFVIALIFSYFAVPTKYQHRVLFWGILGAVALRGIFIVAGAALLAKFAWMIFVFGAFLVYTGIKLLFVGDSGTDPSKNPILLFAQRFLRVTPHFHGKKFFVRENGLLTATPLFLTLFVVELTDVVFAVDSIPAIFAVTRDPFLVFSSNIFAILGLRSLYFVLADMMGRFYYLKYGLGFVLSFVGLKMLTSHWWHLPIAVSLGVIVLLLGGSVAASWLWPPEAVTEGKKAGNEGDASAAKQEQQGDT